MRSTTCRDDGSRRRGLAATGGRRWAGEKPDDPLGRNGETATITAAQLLTQMILGSPGSSAASYTLPTVTLLEAALTNAVRVGQAFDLSIMNVDGSGSGVITVLVGTGWTITGLATVAATAGTSSQWRARKTGTGTWTLYRLS